MTKIEPKIVAWRCKDYADGWIYYTNEANAKKYQEMTGCLIQSLVVWETLS